MTGEESSTVHMAAPALSSKKQERPCGRVRPESGEWVGRNPMRFNKSRCRDPRLGRNNHTRW